MVTPVNTNSDGGVVLYDAEGKPSSPLTKKMKLKIAKEIAELEKSESYGVLVDSKDMV